MTTDTAVRAPYLDRTTAANLGAALWACDFPLVVWELPRGVVQLTNEAAESLFELPLSALIGSRFADLVGPLADVEASFATIGAGSVDGVSGERVVLPRNGKPIPVTMWSRAINVDDRRLAVSLYIPAAEIGRLGRDPAAPWRSLTPLVLGITDVAWKIRVVTRDIGELIGIDAGVLRDSNLLDLIHEDDRHSVTDPLGAATGFAPEHRVRVRHVDGYWVDVCVLAAPLPDRGPELVAFAMLGLPPSSSLDSDRERVAELERRLRHIGAEVRAARLLDGLESFPSISDRPELSQLTTRQWEILRRLLQGERIPTIAKALFVSQSTVRNHLANVYATFGVHSQAELFVALRDRPH